MAKKRKKEIRGNVNAVTSCISTTLVLVLLGMIVFFVTTARNFSDSIKENFAISILLDDDMTQAQAYKLQTRLKQMPCTRHVSYISKERASEIQSQALGTNPSEFDARLI